MANEQHNVDLSELNKSEAFSAKSYVPFCTAKSVANPKNKACAGKKEGDAIGHSGTTIGTGVDLGQMNEYDLKRLKLPATLHDKLKPYLGKRGADAQKMAEITLLPMEARLISDKVQDRIISTIVHKYEKDSKKKFNKLAQGTQTAIVDYFYQFGEGSMKEKAHSTFWGHVTDNDWDKAAEFLEDQKGYADRRKRESNLIKGSTDYKK